MGCLHKTVCFIFSIILFIGGLFFLLVGIIGKEAVATVTNTTKKIVQVKRDGKRVYTKKNGYLQPTERTEYHYDYEFVVDGKKYTGSSKETKPTHSKDSKVTIYYLPIYPNFSTTISKLYAILLALFLWLLSYVLMKSFISGRRPQISIGSDALDFGPKLPKNANLPAQNQVVAQQVQPQVQQVVQQPQNINQSNGYAFCPKCGSPLGAGYSFCPKCGFKI